MAMPRSDGSAWVTSLPSIRIVPAGHLLEAGDHPQERGLAAARRPDEDHELALLDREVDARDDFDAAVALADALEFKVGHCCVPPGQPLTAPAVMPATIWRLKKMKTISGGMVTSRMFMKSRFICVLNWLWKL